MTYPALANSSIKQLGQTEREKYTISERRAQRDRVRPRIFLFLPTTGVNIAPICDGLNFKVDRWFLIWKKEKLVHTNAASIMLIYVKNWKSDRDQIWECEIWIFMRVGGRGWLLPETGHAFALHKVSQRLDHSWVEITTEFANLGQGWARSRCHVVVS